MGGERGGTKTKRREGKKGRSCSKSMVHRKETVSGTMSTEHNPIRSGERKAVCEGCRRMGKSSKGEMLPAAGHICSVCS